MAASFITFEGLDGSGKSTHLTRAAAWMEARGLEVCATHEPGGTPLSDAIRATFLDPRWGEIDGQVEALLVFASRRQHLLEVIEPSLARGCYVLCDRFTDSTRVYQGTGRGLDGSWIDELDRLATDRRQPDHTLLFDLPSEVAHLRRRAPQQAGDVDRIDAESLDFYRRIRAGYLELARREPRRFRLIDSSGDIEATWQQVAAALEEILPSSGRSAG